MAGGVVTGELVVQFERCALQSAAVHRTEHHLALQRTEQQQVLDDVRAAEQPVDPWTGQRGLQPVQQVDPVAHGQRPVADAVGAAGRVVAGDDHQPAVGRDQRGLGPGVGRPLGSHPGR